MADRDVSENKYRARRTWSESCKILFGSKREAEYGERLFLAQKAGAITNLRFHQNYLLSAKPKITIEVDFVYVQDGLTIYQDSKGYETREYRVKRLWAADKLGIHIELV